MLLILLQIAELFSFLCTGNSLAIPCTLFDVFLSKIASNL